MKIHPVAELFPMLADDELRELSDDIRENGLQHPIAVWDGILVDGRNRLAACKMAGIKPEFKEVSCRDIKTFIVSANLKRRHLTREQRDEVIRGLRGQGMTIQKIAGAVGVSVGKVQSVAKDVIFNSEIENTRGQSRPANYAPRENKPHVANNSGDNEWYTPKPFIEAARSVMGKIDLDPASTPEANKIVGAETIFTAEQNGLKQEWANRIWLNPPYEAGLIGKFIEKLAASVESGKVTEALILVNNATETKWFARLASVSSMLCFPEGRVKFWHPRKESVPLQGQCVAYIGAHKKKFADEFGNFGIIAELV